jgi:hypothetical protein
MEKLISGSLEEKLYFEQKALIKSKLKEIAKQTGATEEEVIKWFNKTYPK